MTAATMPYLSVIVPAHRGEEVLRQSLPALLGSDLPRADWELIVVDDASPDETRVVAAEYADVVVRLRGSPRGPAYARNRGVEVSRGEVVVFVDADVVVHSDVLRRMADAFHADAGLASIFGSYDDDPHAPGLISQFRNLLHHHVHQSSPGAAETFWAGCGAVRRDVLIETGMMDAWHFPRPQIEDIELGRRLRRSGHRIELRPDIQCTHLKRWTLRNMVTTDFRDRGTPWMWLLLSEGAAATPATLNLRPREKLCTALVAVTALALAAGAVFRSGTALAVAAAAALGVVALNHRFYALLLRTRGPLFAAAAVPLHLLFYFTGGLAGIAGIIMYYAVRVPRPPAAAAERASAAWPPPADRPAGSSWALAGERARREART
jgi:GT2 family glycosyltransferase